MKKNWIYSLALSAIVLASCGGAEDANDAEKKKDAPGATATEQKGSEAKIEPTFSAKEGTESVRFTGFKLAEKKGVDGTFEVIEVKGYNQNATSVPELMKEVKITMDVSSTKTGDTIRDGKIVKSFFGTMDSTQTLKAKVISFNEDGTAIININMNNMILEQNMTWELYEETSLTLSGTINIPSWGGQAALDALNVVCEAKHKGEGDVALTWPDVNISATVNIVKK